jgi:hypothetical protein
MRLPTRAGAALTVALAGGAMTPASAQVRVAIVVKGDVGHYAGMCDGGAGTDSLAGTVDLQYLRDDGSAMYAGRLSRVTEVEACGTKPAPTEDQVEMCLANLSGRAPMRVTIEVYEDDRGAWVKSEPVAPRPSEPVKKEIRGCPEPGEYLQGYPADGWMSGLGLESVPSGRLRNGRYTTGNVTLTVY